MSSIHIFGLEKGARTCQQIKAQTIFIEIFFAQELCQIFCPSFSKVWSMCSRQRQRTSQPCARSPTSRTCLSHLLHQHLVDQVPIVVGDVTNARLKEFSILCYITNSFKTSQTTASSSPFTTRTLSAT